MAARIPRARRCAILNGKKVAILVAEGFEQSETLIVSPAKGEVQGWNHFDKAERFHVDVPIEEADADEFDALLLPGGVANPDQLRVQPKAVEFVKRFVDSGRPIGVICHGPWTLKWVDEEVVVDRGIVSSRKLVEEIQEGPHKGRGRSGAARPRASAGR